MKVMLIGSTFPLSLIRRTVRIEPKSIDDLVAAARGREIVSFWGHANTMEIAERLIGFSVSPINERPSLTLTEESLPSLDGTVFTECWVVSPDYRPGFRPEVGTEVEEPDIIGWQVLHLVW